MSKHLILSAFAGSLALLTFAETASAQFSFSYGRGWDGRRAYSIQTPYGSYSRGYPYGYGYGNPYYGGYGYRRGYSIQLGSPYYSNYDSYPSYSYPSYGYSSGWTDYSMQPVIPSQQSFYSGPSAAPEKRAFIRVIVPHPQARVWFEDSLMQQQGTERVFVTPDLTEGAIHSYSIKAAWMEDGQEVSRVKKTEFRAGERVTVAFGMRDGADQPARPREEARPLSDAVEPADLVRASTMSGKVVRVEKGELVMTDKNGNNRHSHRLAADTEIIINGRKALTDDLKAGAEIEVTLKKGDTNTAAKIEVMGASEKASSSESLPPE